MWVIAALTMMAACMEPASTALRAQTVTRAEFDALKAEVAKLRRELGPYGDSIPPAVVNGSTCAELPNQRYNVMCRMQQIGTGIDANNAAVIGLALKVSQVVVAPPPSGTIGNTVNGDLIVNGRVCIQMQCAPAANALIQMTGQSSTGMLVFSNANGQNGQGAAKHCSEITWSADGGMRLEHNVYYSDAGMVWCEAPKPRTILGFDSRGTLSLSQDYDGVIDPSQVLVFRIDRSRNFGAFTLMKPGMKACIGWSNAVNDFANLWCPGTGNSARRGAAGVRWVPPVNTTER